jgi:DNA-binding MarR family transcriptional regulator
VAAADDDVESEASLTEAVLTASRALVAVAARSLSSAAATAVTLPQYRALVVLAAHGPQRMGDLAEALGVHPSTATRLCDRLVDRQLVRRAVDRVNRRETSVALSPAGRALVDAVTDVRRAEIRAIVERIPAESRATAVAALRAFADAAGEPPQAAWTLGWT